MDASDQRCETCRLGYRQAFPVVHSRCQKVTSHELSNFLISGLIV